MRLVTRVRSALDVELSLRTLFDHPTVSALAERVGSTPAVQPAGRIGTVPREGAIPLSIAQQRLWVLSQFVPDSTEYNLGAAFRLDGHLDVAALTDALHQVVARHEPLRTTFGPGLTPGEPVQVIRPAPAVAVTRIDLSTPDGQDRATALHRTLTGALTEPYDLLNAPGFRVLLVQLAANEHVLFLGMHHIAVDGWSIGVLFAELEACYSAITAGGSTNLPPLPVQYADFAVWQRNRLTGSDLEEDLDYWRHQLTGIESLELPADRPRNAVGTAAGATHPLHFPTELTARLKSLGKRRDATLFMVLVAAVKVLLARYSGQQDIAVGTATSGRDRAELDRLVGFFVNTLVLRSDVNQQLSFVDFLDRERATVLEAFTHQQLPFDRVVQAVQPQRDAIRTPLIQAMVVLQDTAATSFDLPGLRVRSIPLPNTAAQFDLTFQFREQSGDLHCLISYNADLFDHTTVERMGRHLMTLAEHVTSDPDIPMRRLPPLDTANHRQIQAVDATGEVTLTELFAWRVARHPHLPAVRAGGTTITYRELDTWADAIAHRLSCLGVRRGDRVCTVFEPGAEAVAGFVALAKIGAVYVPMESDTPPERRRFVLEDSAPAVLLTTKRALRTPLDTIDTVWLDDISSAGEGFTAAPALVPADPLCCVYTSGSTGRPKGVVLTHHNVANLITGDRWHFGDVEGERCGQVASLSFDASVWELWSTLARGGCLCIAEPHVRRDARLLARWVVREGLVFCFFPTVIGERLIADGALTEARQLRHMVCGGDKLTKLPAEPVPFRVVNAYGPTEGGIVTSLFDTTGWRAGTRGRHAPPPIGRPIAGREAKVLDQHLREVPAGCTGELYISGFGVAQGYLGEPGLTARHFVADPFASRPGRRMYRSGDLVRRTADGLLEFCGRVDRQLKIRGVRVELDEIEWAITRCPEVREAAVVVPGGDREPAIAAYLTSESGQPVDIDALRTALREYLPEAMQPTWITQLDAMPKTRNGKTDRNALAGLAGTTQADSGTARAHSSPQTDMESAVAACWAEVLGRAGNGIDEKFFDVGGSSLTLLDLRDRLETLCRSELPIGLLFEHPTIGEMARLIEQRSPEHVQDERHHEF